jgi:hypothetical protein
MNGKDDCVPDEQPATADISIAMLKEDGILIMLLRRQPAVAAGAAG